MGLVNFHYKKIHMFLGLYFQLAPILSRENKSLVHFALGLVTRVLL